MNLKYSVYLWEQAGKKQQASSWSQQERHVRFTGAGEQIRLGTGESPKSLKA